MNFIFPLPETTNQAYRSGRGHWYKSEKAQSWENKILWELKKLRLKSTKGTIRVEIIFYVKRDRDIDGGIKPILDILAKGNLYENDRQVVELHVQKFTDKEKPRAVVSVELIKNLFVKPMKEGIV